MFTEQFAIFADSHFTLSDKSYYTIYNNGKFEILLEDKNDINKSQVIFSGSFEECEKHREQMKSDYIKSKLGREQKNVYR